MSMRSVPGEELPECVEGVQGRVILRTNRVSMRPASSEKLFALVENDKTLAEMCTLIVSPRVLIVPLREMFWLVRWDSGGSGPSCTQCGRAFPQSFDDPRLSPSLFDDLFPFANHSMTSISFQSQILLSVGVHSRNCSMTPVCLHSRMFQRFFLAEAQVRSISVDMPLSLPLSSHDHSSCTRSTPLPEFARHPLPPDKAPLLSFTQLLHTASPFPRFRSTSYPSKQGFPPHRPKMGIPTIK